MKISFDYETKQKVMKLSAEEEGLLLAALCSAQWHTYVSRVAEFCKELREELKNEAN